MGEPEHAHGTHCLVTEWIDSGSSCERVGHQRMQALHPIGHASSADTRDLRHRIEPFPVGQISFVGPAIGQRKIVITLSR